MMPTAIVAALTLIADAAHDHHGSCRAAGHAFQEYLPAEHGIEAFTFGGE